MITIGDFYKQKSKRKLGVITCYDYTSAKILNDTAIDCLLVGDSLAMTMHGFSTTLSATVEMMCWHTAAVNRGAPDKFIVTDLPFLSYRQSVATAVSAVLAVMQAGAQAIKLECAAGNLDLIRHLVESGVPVMGHLGLTPQFIHLLGGYKVQGKSESAAAQIKEDALKLQEAGCFSLVLEGIPSLLAKEITVALSIPTIGIGAGPHTDGQVLVFQDLLGLTVGFKPKFVKQFMEGQSQIKQAVADYIHAVQVEEYPADEHCYSS